MYTGSTVHTVYVRIYRCRASPFYAIYSISLYVCCMCVYTYLFTFINCCRWFNMRGHVCVAVLPLRLHSLLWTSHAMDTESSPSGFLVGGSDGGNITVWNASSIIKWVCDRLHAYLPYTAYICILWTQYLSTICGNEFRYFILNAHLS